MTDFIHFRVWLSGHILSSILMEDNSSRGQSVYAPFNQCQTFDHHSSVNHILVFFLANYHLAQVEDTPTQAADDDQKLEQVGNMQKCLSLNPAVPFSSLITYK